MKLINHYNWLEKHLDTFWRAVFDQSLEDSGYAGIIGAHGDKGEQYDTKWERAGIPFPHAMAVFLLTYTSKMDRPKHESAQWVIDNYHHYVDLLPAIDETDEDVICPFAKAKLDSET